MFQKAKTVIWNFIDRMASENIAAYAASTAYFFFLSIVPILLLVFMVLPYTPLTQNDVKEIADSVLPDQLNSTAFMLLDSIYERSTTTLPVVVIVTIWSAGTGTLALKRGLNAIHHIEEKRNYFIVRFFSCLNTLVMLLAMIILMLLFVFENQLVSLAVSLAPETAIVWSALQPFRYVALSILLLFLVALIYTYLPTKKRRFLEQLPGATFTALSWAIFSYGFSWYVSFADYSVYGSLSVVVIFMLWLYMCMYILLVGAYINAYFKKANRAFIRSRYERRAKEKAKEN